MQVVSDFAVGNYIPSPGPPVIYLESVYDKPLTLLNTVHMLLHLSQSPACSTWLAQVLINLMLLNWSSVQINGQTGE